MARKTSLGVPRCPNHCCRLQLDTKQKSQRKGSAPCEISGQLFEFTQDPTINSKVKDKYGNLTTQKGFIVEGSDNG